WSTTSVIGAFGWVAGAGSTVSKPLTRTVCLVSPGHLSSNPRLVKEAHALRSASYHVTVAVSDQVPWFSELDQAMPESRELTGPRLLRQPTWRRRLARLRQEGYRVMLRIVFHLKLKPGRWLLAEAFQPACRRLRAALRETDFDLVIAHNLAALPAAAEVATDRGVPYAFDAEDSHVDELHEHQHFERRLRTALERAYLPGAAYVSASSPGIAEVLQQRYAVAAEVILNVFPQPRSPLSPPPPLAQRPDQPIRFFWFSQTIGPDRGLQSLLEVAGALRRPVALTLVGKPVPGFDRELDAEAERYRVQLRLMSLVPPDDLYELAAAHDCGLALEPTAPPNRDLCLVNKIFTYLAVGLPCLLSKTGAHQDLAPQLGAAAQLVDNPMDPAVLNRWIDDHVAPGRAAAAARAAFNDRFNWQRESERYLACVRGALKK
ncbi:MAG: glycosyltransferase, partial [Pseudomonadota bacterium]